MIATASTSQWSEIVPVTSLSYWQIQALKGVLQMEHLRRGWDSYGSPVPSQKAVDASISLVTDIHFDELPVPYVVPVSGGGVQLEWIVDQRELELEILPDGTVEFLKTENGEPLEEGTLKTAVRGHVGSLLVWLTSST